MIKKLIWGAALFSALSCSKIRVENATDEFDDPKRLVELKNKTLDEVSGIAASISNPGYFWVHNDSGNQPEVYLIDRSLKIVMTCKLENVDNRDWEDIAIGPGPEKGTHYLYVGEIGDNEAQYRYKHILRFPEPVFDGSNDKMSIADFDTITFFLEDKQKDTEALLIDPVSRDLYVLSKREEPVWLYHLPFPHSTTDTLVAKRLYSLPLTQIVGGDVSPDGRKILLKNYEHIYYWSSNSYKPVHEVLKGTPHEVPYELEPQGEAIAWARDLSGFYTLSEKNVGKKTYFYFYRSASEGEISKQ